MRVRPAGNISKRTTILAQVGSDAFEATYKLARQGKSPAITIKALETGQVQKELKRLWEKCKERSKKRGTNCDVDVAFLDEMLVDQGYHCAVSGLEFDLTPTKRRRPFAISVDRIDPKLGYAHKTNKSGLVVTHQGSVDLRALTAPPVGIKFENHSSLCLRRLTGTHTYPEEPREFRFTDGYPI